MAIKYDRTYLLTKFGRPQNKKATGKLSVMHETANAGGADSDRAKREASFMSKNWRHANTHMIVGYDRVYVMVEPGYTCGGAGPTANALSPLQVELCHYNSKSLGLKAYKLWIQVLVTYGKKFGIPKTVDSSKTTGFKAHKWVSAKWHETTHDDPWSYLSYLGITKTRLAKDLGATAPANAESVSSSKTSSKTAAKVETINGHKVDGYWGPDLTKQWQHVINMRIQDGKISGQPTNAVTDAITGLTHGTSGSPFVGILQKHAGVTQDKKLGPDSLKGFQKKMGTGADGKLSKPSPFVKAVQRKVYAGKVPF
jgi:N-acetylmuramoyl-L-alanine amidase CwlA